jgi:dUTP pyrophosphatase
VLKFMFSREGATTPSVGHPGDLGYDIYAAEEVLLYPNIVAIVPTGLHIELTDSDGAPLGAIVKDRSSMAKKGIAVSGGVIDAGYRGEILVPLTLHGHTTVYLVKKGDKIAQMIPVKPNTSHTTQLVKSFDETSRGTSAFGSTGK